MRRLVLAGLLWLCCAPAVTAASGRHDSSLTKGYLFLDRMMDRYARGSTLRLVQSYTGGYLGRVGYTDSVTYDDALIIDALLARGTRDDLARSRVIGDALLYAQAHDPRDDGRIRAAYAPRPLTSPGKLVATDATSDVGNMAWVGQALLQLYDHTGARAYLNGAVAIGSWIQRNARDNRGAGGYTGGQRRNGSIIEWKSTEHNIDVYALFTLLARATHQSVWITRADWARRFVEAMWSQKHRFFWVGTGTNGVTINTGFRPEDVNSWSYLAFRDPRYAASIDWDIKYLAVRRGGFTGVSFCQGDRSGVWFEGTAHLADALEARGAGGDARLADGYLADIKYAQANGPNADGLGVIAASKRLSDCDGDHYYASLHTGATAWYLLALQHADPFGVLRRPTLRSS